MNPQTERIYNLEMSRLSLINQLKKMREENSLLRSELEKLKTKKRSRK